MFWTKKERKRNLLKGKSVGKGATENLKRPMGVRMPSIWKERGRLSGENTLWVGVLKNSGPRHRGFVSVTDWRSEIKKKGAPGKASQGENVRLGRRTTAEKKLAGPASEPVMRTEEFLKDPKENRDGRAVSGKPSYPEVKKKGAEQPRKGSISQAPGKEKRNEAIKKGQASSVIVHWKGRL